jgi:hypothetical protein
LVNYFCNNNKYRLKNIASKIGPNREEPIGQLHGEEGLETGPVQQARNHFDLEGGDGGQDAGRIFYYCRGTLVHKTSKSKKIFFENFSKNFIINN